jgi:hypothetical protein
VAGGTATITVTSVANSTKKAEKQVIVGDLLVPAGGDIQEVIDEAEEGNVIALAPGVYDIGKTRIVIRKGISLIGAGRDKTTIRGTVHRAGTPANDIVQPMLLTIPQSGITVIKDIHFHWVDDEEIGSNSYSALSLAGNNVIVTGCEITTDISGANYITIVNIGRSGGGVVGEAGVAAQEITLTDNIVHGTVSIVPSVKDTPMKVAVTSNTIQAVNMEGIWTYCLNTDDELTIGLNTITGVPVGMYDIKLMEKVKSVNGNEDYTGMQISLANMGATVLLNYLADSSWYDSTKSSFTISTAEQLLYFAGLVNSGTDFKGKTVTLGADLDLGSLHWIPIGNDPNQFGGTFDGGGKTISNLIVDYPGTRAGLFGYVASVGELRNLTIQDASIEAGGRSGVLVGDCRGTINDVTVKNSEVKGNGSYIGGLVGYSYANINNCSVIDTFVASTAETGITVGGLVGFAGESKAITIAQCNVTNTDVNGYLRVGGFVGLLHGGNTVDSCHVTGGTVTGDKYTGTIPPHEFANKILKTGGFAGDVYLTTGNVIITQCSTTANLGGNPEDYHKTVGPFIGNVDDGKGMLWVKNCTENGNPLDFVLVSTGSELTVAIADTESNTIILNADIAVEGMLTIKRKLTLNGNGYTIAATAAGAKHAVKVEYNHTNDGTVIKDLTIEAAEYTGDIIYVSTAKNVTITDCTLISTDNLAMGLYFDRTSSGTVNDCIIKGRKGIGADTTEAVRIENNHLTFTTMGIELHDGSASNTVVINKPEDEATAQANYTVSGNTFVKISE